MKVSVYSFLEHSLSHHSLRIMKKLFSVHFCRMTKKIIRRIKRRVDSGIAVKIIYI